MRSASNHKERAFTVVELVVVLFVLAALIAIWTPFTRIRDERGEVWNISCINNLKQIGTAYRLWANDHNDLYPAAESIANGGWREILTNAEEGSNCWTNYAIMGSVFGSLTNQDSRFPKILCCPADNRTPAMKFDATNQAESDFHDNLSVSYFVGASASDNEPDSLLAGDRNLGAGGKPGRGYGYSPDDGYGNDVAISTNFHASPISWSREIHYYHRSVNSWGNILLGDGACVTLSTSAIGTELLNRLPPTTEWPAGSAPSSPSIRVIFP